VNQTSILTSLKKLQNRIDDNYSTYSPVDGYGDLKDAICRKLKRDNNLDYSPSQNCSFDRTKQSLYNIAQVMLNDGDEVIYQHHTGFLISNCEIIGGTL
jgi:aspartate/methionine/tyrosine aminotransferase